MTSPDLQCTPRVLLIDDDAASGRLVTAVLRPERMEVFAAESAQDGFDALERHDPDLIVLDMRLPDMSGLEVLEKLRQRGSQPPVIVLTGKVDVKTAVRAMQLGAFHYLTKPMDRDELVLVLRRALESRCLLEEVRDLRKRAEPASLLIEQMGRSDSVRKIVEQVAQVAALDLTVLILGETGTGKELVAQTIHRQSPRRGRPLIAVDCGAIPEALLESELFGHEKGAFTGAEQRRKGQFQLAEGGTLFLDETANLPVALQPKLLRVLESRELRPVGGTQRTAFDVRILAASNVGLQQQVRQGRFREDLYFRLAQFTIRVPPLRERSEDIPHLVQRFAAEFCLELKRPIIEITNGAMLRLHAHRWPGNVRELRNIVRQAIVRATSLVVDEPLIDVLLSDQPDVSAATADLAEAGGATLRQIGERAAESAERSAICTVLRQVKGNKSAAARQLQTDYKTLHTKIRRYDITPADYA